MKIVATTSLPAVHRPNADRWNAARSRQYEFCLLSNHPPHPHTHQTSSEKDLVMLYSFLKDKG